MRQLFFASVAAIFLMGSLGANAEKAEGGAKSPASAITVYYFHGDFRCPTCRKLEQYSKEAVENNFGNELTLGKIVFKTINVDKKGNEHFVNDYQLATKSLVVSL
ncbi:MAG: nitrophenyl compound nitroreductase subunit ArsF family protein, partial [Candidatus Omnitrophica bacterium]|nr:nitrophenyl compound nitroreductase subunit ArsF family protein [Candidatus Omnitrophota bacterium]